MVGILNALIILVVLDEHHAVPSINSTGYRFITVLNLRISVVLKLELFSWNCKHTCFLFLYK